MEILEINYFYLATICVLVIFTSGSDRMLSITKVPTASGESIFNFAIKSHSPNKMCASDTSLLDNNSSKTFCSSHSNKAIKTNAIILNHPKKILS